MESTVIEMARSGVMDPKLATIAAVSLKRPAQTLWPKHRAITNTIPRRIDSFIATYIALLALLGLPAPSSFETLVLHY